MSRSLLTVVLVACTGSSAAVDPAPIPRDPIAPPTDHQTLTLPGDSRGAIWDPGTRTLLLTDDTHATIVRWSDARGFENAATIPPSQRVALGGIVRISDDRLLVTSFGFGIDGGVIALAHDGDVQLASAALPRLDPARRRMAIARSDDTLFVAYFTAKPGTRPAGGVARLDLEGGRETEAITTGLQKPVGLAASKQTLYVADADRNVVYAYPLADLRSRTVLAKDLAGVDLLTLLPGGDLVTGGNGAVQRITATGKVSTIASGFEQVRGTAYDPEGRRLFVVEHSAASSRRTLHVLPLTVH